MMNICNKYEFIIILVCIIGLFVLTSIGKLNQEWFMNLFGIFAGYAIKGKIEKVKGDTNVK